MKKLLDLCVFAYIFVGLFTYGHAYNNLSKESAPEPPTRFTASAFAGAFWPLYYSVKLQEKP